MSATAADDTTDLTWDSILWARLGQSRAPGLILPASANPTIGKAALVSMSAIDMEIDETKMSAKAIISTPTPDRSEDVVEPLGIDLSDYKKNPVVYFDHGFSGIYLPIGKSEDPDGKLTVIAKKTHVEAESFFAQSMYEARQIFELIKEKIIRTTSVNFLPLEASVRKRNENGGRPGLHISKWGLLEWSWTGIPDNPQCVAKWHDILAKGRLDSDPICEPILKYFAPIAPERRAIGKGFDPTDKPNPGSDSMPDVTNPADDKGKPAEVTTGPEFLGDDLEKPTAKHLSALHGHYLKGAAYCRQMAAVNENPEAKDHLTTHAEFLDGLAAENAAVYAKCFPGAPALGKEAEDDPDGAALLKFLTEGQSHRLRLQGFIPALEKMAGHKALSPREKSIVGDLSVRLSKFLGDARTAAAAAQAEAAKAKGGADAPADQADPEIAKMLEETKQLLKRADQLQPVTA